MKVTFRLVESKADKSGFCPVFLDCSYLGKRLRYFTGEKCKVQDWDLKRVRFRRSFEGWLSANDLLDSLESRLLSSCRGFRANVMIPSVEQLRDSLCPQVQRQFKKAADDLFSTAVSRIRQPIESLFNWINKKTDLQNASKVRAINGLFVHIFGALATSLFYYIF